LSAKLSWIREMPSTLQCSKTLTTYSSDSPTTSPPLLVGFASHGGHLVGIMNSRSESWSQSAALGTYVFEISGHLLGFLLCFFFLVWVLTIQDLNSCLKKAISHWLNFSLFFIRAAQTMLGLKS